MGWFKKEDTELDSVPELPELPDLPEIENIETKTPEVEIKPMPPIPGTTQNLAIPVRPSTIQPTPDMQRSNFINNTPQRNDEVFEYRKPEPSFQEPRYEYTIKEPQAQRIREQPRYQEPSKKEYSRPRERITDPVFVRLDNFEATMHSIQEIKGRLNEIEKLIMKTREIKDQEDRELEEWEREVQIIRTKMDEIDKNIFEKI